MAEHFKASTPFKYPTTHGLELRERVMDRLYWSDLLQFVPALALLGVMAGANVITDVRHFLSSVVPVEQGFCSGEPSLEEDNGTTGSDSELEPLDDDGAAGHGWIDESGVTGF